MKKTLLGILICGSTLSALAQDSNVKTTTTTTSTAHKYYYYPESNVYFDEVTGNYWYQDKGATQWTKTQTLPATIIVEKTQQNLVPFDGDEPWKNNMKDVKKYKTKKNGAVKIKMKDKE